MPPPVKIKNKGEDDDVENIIAESFAEEEADPRVEAQGDAGQRGRLLAQRAGADASFETPEWLRTVGDYALGPASMVAGAMGQHVVPERINIPGVATGAAEAFTSGHLDELGGALSALGHDSGFQDALNETTRGGAIALDTGNIGPMQAGFQRLAPEALMDAATAVRRVQEDPGSYRRGRDRVRGFVDRVRGDSPGSVNVGTGLGTAMQAGLVPNAAGLVPRSGGAVGRLAAAGAEGGVLGALAGEGFSEAETPAGVANDAANAGLIGMATGGLMQGAGEGVRAVGARIPQSLADDSRNLSLGMTAADLNRMSPMDRHAVAEGARAAGLTPFLRGPGAYADRARSRLSTAGGTISDFVDRGDDLAGGQRAITREAVERQLGSIREMQGSRASVVRRRGKRALAEVDQAFDEPASFREAQDLSNTYGREAGYTAPVRPGQAAATQEIGAAIRRTSADVLDEMAPGMGPEFQAARGEYRNLIPVVNATELAQVASRARVGNFGLMDAQFVSNGRPGLGALARLYQSRRHGIQATGLEALQRIAQSQPNRLGTFGEALGNAARRGPAAFGASVFHLASTNPEARQMLQDQSLYTATEEAPPEYDGVTLETATERPPGEPLDPELEDLLDDLFAEEQP